MVSQLVEFLEQNDMRAYKLWEKAYPTLVTIINRDDLSPLKQQIESFDFSEALSTLNDLMSRYPEQLMEAQCLNQKKGQKRMPDKTSQTAALKSSLKQRSLAGTLTLLLTLTVTVVTLVIAGIFYVAVSKSEYRQLEEKADYFISSIDDVLEIPLWNIDHENIQKIAQAYADNELFEYLEIRDDLNTLFFNYSRNRGAPVIHKSGKIFHDGRLVGHINMAFTTQGLIHRNHKILFSGLGILIIIVFFL
eukprot:TRINITY_DN35592_c0_g1_i1.p1 TRINITY_DN35592_c0_g1~~TRINITY_DN35592_c0_g1_i1.p1  ORF type:complete len:248 (+),score=23.75 TRINITY_DN35592_c0_g1_i1:287-1030(+)